MTFEEQLQALLDQWRNDIKAEQGMMTELTGIINELHHSRRRAFERLGRFAEATAGSPADVGVQQQLSAVLDQFKEKRH